MTLGDWITWITLAAGAFALLRLAYRRWLPWLRYYAIIVYYAIDDYVWVSHSHKARERIATNRQSDAVNRTQTDPVQHAEPRFEPTDLTPDELVQLLALITVVRDGERRQLSQEIISRAAGISKVTAATMIAAARGTPDPPPLDPYQFEKTGPRETYQRTGVKPLRG